MENRYSYKKWYFNIKYSSSSRLNWSRINYTASAGDTLSYPLAISPWHRQSLLTTDLNFLNSLRLVFYFFFISDSSSTMGEKDLKNTIRRRVASISGHLIPIPPSLNPDSIHLSGASINDSYHRKHGAVSTHPVVWSIAGDDSGKEFTDIIYEKAVGEAIAKVSIEFQIREFDCCDHLSYICKFLCPNFVDYD